MSTTAQRMIFLTIIFIIIAITIFAVIFGLKKPKQTQKINLEFWSVYDQDEYFINIIKEYKRLYPSVTITYVKKTFNDYEKDLIDAFAAGRGPDIWSIHNTWLPKHKNKIIPLSPEMMTIQSFKDTFVDVTFQDLVNNNQIYGLPLFVDSLALYWNKNIFQSNGIAEPPQTWDDFVKDAKLLTKKDDFGNIIRVGASLGTAKNINRSTDILGLLMLQTGTQMTDLENTKVIFNKFVSLNGQPFAAGEEALRFYTDFANPVKPNYSWNRALPNSRDLFAAGKLAFYFGFASESSKIRDKNPNLNFDLTFFPQPKGSAVAVTFGKMWGLAVLKNSPNAVDALSHILAITSAGPLALWSEATGLPPVRRDLLSASPADPYQSIFYDSAIRSRGWLDPNPAESSIIFQNMIESVTSGELESGKAIEAAGRELNSSLKRI